MAIKNCKHCEGLFKARSRYARVCWNCLDHRIRIHSKERYNLRMDDQAGLENKEYTDVYTRRKKHGRKQGNSLQYITGLA